MQLFYLYCVIQQCQIKIDIDVMLIKKMLIIYIHIN